MQFCPLFKKLTANLCGFVAGSSKTGIPEKLALPVRVIAHLTVSGGFVHQMRPITIVLYTMALVTLNSGFPRQPMACNAGMRRETEHTTKQLQICHCTYASNCRRANGQAFATGSLYVHARILQQHLHACSFKVHCDVSSKAA